MIFFFLYVRDMEASRQAINDCSSRWSSQANYLTYVDMHPLFEFESQDAAVAYFPIRYILKVPTCVISGSGSALGKLVMQGTLLWSSGTKL